MPSRRVPDNSATFFFGEGHKDDTSHQALSLMPAVAFPKDSIREALNAPVSVGQKETLGCKQAILGVLFNATILTTQFLCHNSRSATAEEGVKHHFALSGGGKNQFGDEFLRLLGRMLRVFGHRPERHRDVIPEVAGASVTVFPFLGFFPVFGLSVFPIGCSYQSSHLHFFQIEVIVFGVLHGKPDVLHAVFPVAACSPPLLALPSDAVENGETLLNDPLHRRTAYRRTSIPFNCF